MWGESGNALGRVTVVAATIATRSLCAHCFVGHLLQEPRVVGVPALRAELVAAGACTVEEFVEDQSAEVFARGVGVVVNVKRVRLVGG